ncbi:MAG: DUF3153 domain-containing protein [Nostocales cyanobacterium]|nr:MAG: DUF3153 domain-containing protein [Nostocales cyanobacterium]
MNISNLQKNVLVLIKPLTFIFTNMMKLNTKKYIFSILIIFASFILSGCVEYDLGVNFDNANNGELVQHIKLSETLTSFSGDYVDQWLNSLARRARKLAGSATRISPKEIIVKIPFSNGRELKEKFSGFFNYHTNQKTDKMNELELPSITSNLTLQDNNFLLLSRNHLTYDLDLRSLAAFTSKGNVLTATSSIINLDFSLQTPWGVKNISQTEDAIQPEKNGNQLVWKLKPGELNHVEVVFWLPNLLGIGALIIILFVWGGFYVRYTLLASGFSE